MAPLIDIRNVSKRFGARTALDEFSLGIEPGSVVGVLGPNGAGKTVLISIASGLMRPNEGTVAWQGTPVTSPFPRKLRRQIGLVTQETSLYTELTVRQNLRFAAELFGVRGEARVAEVLAIVGLSERAKDRAGVLSGGMQRRLALARAMLHDPAFLILDEPTLGVDVEARHALWGHVRWLRRSGKTVLISTNHLDEAEALCDWIVVLRDGRQVAEGEPAELLSRTGRCVEIDCQDGSVALLRQRIALLPGVRRIDQTDIGLTLQLDRGQSGDAFAALAFGNDLVQSVRVRAPDMVEVFQALTEAPSE
jgi:ABC-2 type transport system ATP-binding protein